MAREEHRARRAEHPGDHRQDGHDRHGHRLPLQRPAPQQPGQPEAGHADAAGPGDRDQDDLELVAHRCRLPAVADPPHGHQPRRAGRVGLDLLPQPADVDGDRRVVAEGPAPHLGEQLLPGERPARVADQEPQQVELPHRERQLGPAGGHHVAGTVDHEVAVHQARRVGLRALPRPTQHRVDAQHQLPRAERLGDVVVGAQLQAHHPVRLGAQGGQHDDRDVAGLAEGPAHLEAVDPGQHQVEHHQVGRPLSEQPQRRLAGVGLERVVAVGAQVGEHDLAHRRVVVNDHHAGHARSSRRETSGTGSHRPRPPRSARQARTSRRRSRGRAASGCRDSRRTAPGRVRRPGSRSRAPRGPTTTGARATPGSSRTASTPSTSTAGASSASWATTPPTSQIPGVDAPGSRPGRAAGTARTAQPARPTSADQHPRHHSTSIRLTHLVWRTPGPVGRDHPARVAVVERQRLAVEPERQQGPGSSTKLDHSVDRPNA